jgi:hypothetical protein
VEVLSISVERKDMMTDDVRLNGSKITNAEEGYALERLHHVFSSTRRLTTTRENRTRKHKEVDMDIERDTLLQQYTYMSTCRRPPSIQVIACTLTSKFMRIIHVSLDFDCIFGFGGTRRFKQEDSESSPRKLKRSLYQLLNPRDIVVRTPDLVTH